MATAQGTRERQKQATREALIAAAHELFTRESYGAVGAEAIARAAGVTRATFYLHFRSKAEVVVELMRRIELEIMDSFRVLDGLEDPDPESIAAWLHGHAGMWRRYRMEFAAIEQAMADDPLVAEEWHAMLWKVPGVMERLLARMPDDQARNTARLHLMTLMMQLERAFHFSLVRGHDDHHDAVVAVLATQWSALLRG
ncbi:TetR/AcrR family transcriptional regulator [Streptomyces nitrosporeus]|uniref:TetR/AcrR family transcriptional regulator n=1 Tax=Streptomyces nitrosporeus TaxID=28894 RepID=UPI00331AAB77